MTDLTKRIQDRLSGVMIRQVNGESYQDAIIRAALDEFIALDGVTYISVSDEEGRMDDRLFDALAKARGEME